MPKNDKREGSCGSKTRIEYGYVELISDPQRLKTVRAHIAAQTRAIHEELHHNPVLNRLTAPGVTRKEYLVAIKVLSSFYHAVELERLRFHRWDGFALTVECRALKNDLPGQKAVSAELVFANQFELLGGLYVAHGASFGRGLFRKNLRAALPDVPQFFVGQRLRKTMWRSLTDNMEKYGQDAKNLEDLLNGALRSFKTVSKVSHACHRPG